MYKTRVTQTDPRDALRHTQSVVLKVDVKCDSHRITLATVDVPWRNFSKPRLQSLRHKVADGILISNDARTSLKHSEAYENQSLCGKNRIDP